MIQLYQFAISHYCEKVRWALDYKKINYKPVNLIPGPHLFTIRRLAGKSSVPVIDDNGMRIQDSTDIITYLDKKYPQKPLTPQDGDLKKEAINLEEYCDQEIGVHLRRYLYNTLLHDRKLVSSLLLQQGPVYGPKLYAVLFPLVRFAMRKSMNIHPESAKRSEKRLTDALDRLNRIMAKNKFLVGNTFTRADLTAASLLAPLCFPPEHEFKWPDQIPEPIKSFREAHRRDPVYSWVLHLYSTCR